MAEENKQAQAQVPQVEEQQQQELEFNQEAIDYFLENLRKDCQSKGDAYAKQQLEDFGRKAKQVVAENTKNMTLTFEKEREMLVHLSQKNEQMKSGLLAIQHHQDRFN
jgi:hypothetical protein